MIRFRSIVAGASLALALSGCAALDNLVHGDLPAAAASVGDTLVTPAVHAPIAKGAAAAEIFYTGSVIVLTAVIQAHTVSQAQAADLGRLEMAVYNAIVAVRGHVQKGEDASAALDIFNAAYGKLYKAAAADGVALPANPNPPATAPSTSGGAS